jgi:hypothetical protein
MDYIMKKQNETYILADNKLDCCTVRGYLDVRL